MDALRNRHVLRKAVSALLAIVWCGTAVAAATNAAGPVPPTKDSPRVRLVMQSLSSVSVNTAGWTQDDRFIVTVDDMAREVVIWDARNGYIANRVDFPALDPKLEIQSWSVAVDAQSNLKIQSNIRQPDRSICTGMTLNYPLGLSGPWTMARGDPQAPCLASGQSAQTFASHNGRLRLNIRDYPFRIEKADGSEIGSLKMPEPTMAFAADLAPDGRRLALITDGTYIENAPRKTRILIFDLGSSRLAASSELTGYFTDLKWLDNQRLFLSDRASGRDADPFTGAISLARIVEAETGKDMSEPLANRCSMVPIRGGDILAAALPNCAANVAGGSGLERFHAGEGWRSLNTGEFAGRYVDQFVVSPDGSTAVALALADVEHGILNVPMLVALDTRTGATIAKTEAPEASQLTEMQFAFDGKSVGLLQDGEYRRWDLTAAPPMALTETEMPATSTAHQTASPDGRHWFEITGLTERRLSAISTQGGKRESQIAFDHVLAEGPIAGSPLRWAVTALAGIIVWNPNGPDGFANPEVLRTRIIDNRHFFTLASDGRYDTDLGADTSAFRWVVSDEPFQSLGPQTFMRDYFEPRLGPRLMSCSASGNCDAVFRAVPSIIGLNRVLPQVRIVRARTGPHPDLALVDVEVRGGLRAEANGSSNRTDAYDLRLFRNGSLVAQSPGSDPDPAHFDREKWRTENRIAPDRNGARTVRFTVRLPTAPDTPTVQFTAYAFNEDRVKSDTARLIYHRPAMDPARRRVFVVAIGIDAYAEAHLNLQFAAGDARLIGNRLAMLPGGEKARLVVLAGDDRPENARITRAAIGDVMGILGGAPRDAALARLKLLGIDAAPLEAARPDDIVIVSYSGHGWADPKGHFYILPADTTWPDETLPPALESMISTADMTRFLRRIDAGEMALVIDACQSAASVDNGSFKAGPMGDSGLGQLAFDKGLRILAASQADDVALESDTLRQGLLTYALADEGLTADGGRADLDGDGRITLDEWLRYAMRRLPSLGEDLRSGHMTTARGVVIVNRSADARSVQEPSLFDFTGKASPLVLRTLHP